MNISQPNNADKKNTEMCPIIEIDHVDMVFNVANQQLNSFKEYALAALKRELFFKEFKALDDINIKVYPGDVCGIIGTNGSGKSTLLKIVAGVLEPSNGTCEIRGSIAPLIELGAGFDPELTARENVYLNGALLGYSKEFIDEHMSDIIEFAEVEDFMDMPIKNFSSGMVARIAFSIATTTIPEILVVDEALSVGDFLFQRKCEERIANLVENHGTTLLFVSHSVDQVERVCQKAVWIEKGHLITQGPVEEVCEEYRNYQGSALLPEEITPLNLELEASETNIECNASNCSCSIDGLKAENNYFVSTKSDPWIDIYFKTPQNFLTLNIICDNAYHNTTLYYQTVIDPGYAGDKAITLNLPNTGTYHRLLVFDQAITSLRIDITEVGGETNVSKIRLLSFSTIEDALKQAPDKNNISEFFEELAPTKRITELTKKHI